MVPHVDRAFPGAIGLLPIGFQRTTLVGHFLHAPTIIEDVIANQVASLVVRMSFNPFVGFCPPIPINELRTGPSHWATLATAGSTQ